MKILFFKIIAWLIKQMLRLRYTMIEENPSELKKIPKDKPLVFLPNHPAEVDPILLLAHLWPKYRLSPVVVEKFFYFPGAKFFMDSIKAIPIPDFEASVSEYKIKRGDEAYTKSLDRLKDNGAILIYPSGALKRTAKEQLGGTSFVSKLVSEIDDINVVLVRMDGLWGSRFSKAVNGQTPNFWQEALFGIKAVLRNFLFFMPRRKIHIRYEVNPQGLNSKSKLSFNQQLENFYNQYVDESGNLVDTEPLRKVSYSCFKDEFLEIDSSGFKTKVVSINQNIDQEDKDIIDNKIKEVLNKPGLDLDGSEHLSFELGMDSLDAANLYAFVCKTFDGVQKVEPGQIKYVKDLYHLAINPVHEINEVDNQSTASFWPQQAGRPKPSFTSAKTLPQAFLEKCDEMKNFIACSDDITGTLSYQKVKLSALVLSRVFKKLKGDYIGIMLPSSCGAYISILAAYFAGKIPVMINWTAGARNLKYAADLLNIQSVISSEKFLDRLSDTDLSPLHDQLVVLEDLRRKISFKDKFVGLMMSNRSAHALSQSLKLDRIDPKKPAVVLFTSGTESYPKAVPLTHENILENQRAGLNRLGLFESDIMYGVLPPFHSFGFAVTGLFPLLTGLKVFYAADPTDSLQIAQDIHKTKITLFCCAPTFYGNLLKVAKKEQLKSVRLFVSGAEKASDDLKRQCAQCNPDASFVEGYGITECSPIVSICRPNEKDVGVGIILDNLNVKIIHPETGELLANNAVGEVCISGPSVFPGYLGTGVKDPFIIIDNKRYYRTGDLGKVENGCLVLSGRLKRFVKIGGEMVSMQAVEEAIMEVAKRSGFADDNSVCVLVAQEEKGDRPKMAMMTTMDLSRDDVNRIIMAAGFGRIVKVDHVESVKTVPLLGSGKTDYRQITEQLRKTLETLNHS